MDREIPPLAGAPAPADVILPDWLVYTMWAAVAFAALWLVATIFVHLRRRSTNLTSAQQAGVHKDAAPDFLKVDHKAREAAMQRGAAFENELDRREAAEAAGKAPAKKEPANLFKTLAGFASFGFSLFSLLGAVLGTFRTMDAAGTQLSKLDQIGAIVAKYPIPAAICAFVIGYTIYLWISQRKWADAPRI